MTPTAEQQPPRDEAVASPHRRWWWDPDCSLFWVLIALSLLPLWSARYFPSQDGPAHIYNALILRDYHRPSGAVFREYFELNPGPEPNLLGHWIMSGLMLIVRPWVAEKLLITLYIVLLPLSARYAVRAVSRGGSFLAFLSFPLIYSLALHKGLYNFCLGLPLYFYFVGFWLRRRGRFNARGMAVLLGLSLLLYFAHVVALLSAYATVGMVAVTQLALEEFARGRGEINLPSRARNVLSRIILPAFVLLPSLILAARFFLQHRGDPTGIQPAARMLNELRRLSPLVSYRKSEGICAGLVAMLFATLTLCGMWRLLVKRARVSADVLLPALAVSLLFYFLSPNSAAGGGLISPRLMLFCYLLLILWLACTPFPQWAQWAVRASAAILFLWMLAAYTVRYRQLNVYLADYAECAPLIERNATLLPICLTDRGYYDERRPLTSDHVARLFVHAADYVAVDRNLVDLSNYEATQGYFPTLFRPGVSPEGCIKANGEGLLDYPTRSHGRGRIDYVLIWDIHPNQVGDALPESVKRDLAQAYDLIHISPRGFLKLYRRR